MILFANAVLLTTAFVTGAARRWRDFYNTVLFVSFCNLLYNVLCRERMTWIFEPEALLSHKAADLLNTFVLLPATTMVYLYYFPASASVFRKLSYYFLWVLGYSALEFAWFRVGTIRYANEWSFLWSVGFYLAMFFMTRLHHTRPGRALVCSVVVVVFLVARFDVPLTD